VRFRFICPKNKLILGLHDRENTCSHLEIAKGSHANWLGRAKTDISSDEFCQQLSNEAKSGQVLDGYCGNSWQGRWIFGVHLEMQF